MDFSTRMIKGLCCLTLCGFFFLFSSFVPKEQHNIPFEIHKFAFEDIDEGDPVLMDYICGKTIFLNFWASYCKPCVHEMPGIAKAQEALADTDYEFYIVSCEAPWDIKDFEQAYCYPMTHLYGPAGPAHGVKSLPQTFIIRDGDILATFGDARDWSTYKNLELLRSYAGFESKDLMACE